MKNKQAQTYILKFFNTWAPYYDFLAFPFYKLRNEAVSKINTNAKKVLDVACGTGTLSLALAKKGFEVTGVDLSADMLRYARKKAKGNKNITFLQKDASSLDFPENHFDASTISLAIHDMPEKTAIEVLKEIRRVTKKEGQIVIVDYNTPPNPVVNQALKHFESNYYGNYIQKGLKYFIERAGLKLKSRSELLLKSCQVVIC